MRVSGGVAGFTTLLVVLAAADEVSAIPIPVFFGQAGMQAGTGA